MAAKDIHITREDGKITHVAVEYGDGQTIESDDDSLLLKSPWEAMATSKGEYTITWDAD